MTDAHCHLVRGSGRHFVCEPFAPTFVAGEGDAVFYGYHPWRFLPAADEGIELTALIASLEARLAANPRAGVGEIGLDRLKEREISPRMRAAFEEQLRLAAHYRRPVVLHGAKCWGEVVKTISRIDGDHRIPAFLFHGFSRSGGLLPEIVRLNGFISVSSALLNDHAVNYRALVREIPLERLLVESDATEETASELPALEAVLEKLAELKGLSPQACEEALDRTASAFIGMPGQK